MDDFDGEELYDGYDEDEGQAYESESLKDKYDRAKGTYDNIQDHKEKFNKLKEKYGNKSANNSAGNVGKNAGKDAAKQSGKEAAKEGAKQTGKEVAKQGSKEVAKQTGKEAGKQVAKQAGKTAVKEGAKVAAEGAAASTGVGVVVAAGIEAADKLKKVQDKIDNKIKEETGVDVKKVKRWSIPAIIFAIFMLLFIFPAMAMYSVSETATSELTTLVRTREETNNSKKLIMFTKSEIKDLLNNDLDNISEDIAKKLAEEGYTLEYEDGKYKSISYKNILKSYGSDLTNVFMPNDISNAATGMEDVLSDEESYDSLNEEDKDVAVSMKNVKKYLLAEIENFNKVEWNLSKLDAEYNYNTRKVTFDSLSKYQNDTNKFSVKTNNGLSNEAITDKSYTVKDDNNKDTMLKMPKLAKYGVDVSEGENVVARTYVDMLEPYMQKWIIPYTIYIDTQDEDFVNSIMEEMYHPATVCLFKLQKAVKTSEFEYYLECNEYRYSRIVRKSSKKSDVGENAEKQHYDYSADNGDYRLYAEGLNTRDKKLGQYIVSEEFITKAESGGYVYKQVISEIKLTPTPKIALDSSGNEMVKKITVERKLEDGATSAELTNVASFYEIINREYTIIPIDENSMPDNSTPTELIVDEETGTGKQSLIEEWSESLLMENNETEKYKVSYYDEEDYEDLGRDISRIEWYQDWIGVSHAGSYAGLPGENKDSLNSQQEAFIERISKYAIENAKVTGIYPSVTIAQCIIESGWGKDEIAVKYGNHFGQKAFSTNGNEYWSGDRVNLNASEGGKSYFKVYSKMDNYNIDDLAFYSVMDYGRNFWVTATYNAHGVFECMTKNLGPKEQLRRIAQSGYAVMLDGSITKPDGKRTYDQYLYDEFIVAYDLEKYDKDENGMDWWDGTIPAFATSLTVSGNTIGSGGLGDTLYSYDDMYFAYYQIEQWYAQSEGTLSGNTISIVNLPDGGFGWPLSTTGDTAKIYRLYGNVNSYSGNHDGIDIFNGSNTMLDNEQKLIKGVDVAATHSGTVTKVNKVTTESSYAYIEIKTEDGNFKTHYGCLSEILVSENDPVTKGQLIGKVGKTGAHSGDTELYLHYEMYYKGENVDPLKYYNIQDSEGKLVENYDEIDKTNVAPNTYSYYSSKLYVAGESFVEDGDQSAGYSGIYHSSSGRTYVEYRQDWGPWANQKIPGWSSKYNTMGKGGCWMTSCAIILSGYGHPEITPMETYKLYVSGKSGTTHGSLAMYATNANPYTVSNYQTAKNAIIKHLSEGYATKIFCKKSRGSWVSSQHSMAVLDIRSKGGTYEVYLSPVCGYKGGWLDIDYVLKGLDMYWLVKPAE